MPLSVKLRRPAYRVAYHLLRVAWLLSGIEREGVKCLLSDGDRVLLVRHTYGPRGWDLPGGALKRGEPPARAAHREMHEELGIDDDGWTELGLVEARNDRRRGRIHLFGTEVRAPNLRLDHGELDVAEWFERDRLPALVPLSASIMRALDGAA
jgi:8-oxo-dGTP pyrophosphatase MutT (NUDIX family)